MSTWYIICSPKFSSYQLLCYHSQRLIFVLLPLVPGVFLDIGCNPLANWSKVSLTLSTVFALVLCCTIPGCEFYHSLAKKMTSGYTCGHVFFTFISCLWNSLTCEIWTYSFSDLFKEQNLLFLWQKLSFSYFLLLQTKTSKQDLSRNCPRNSHQAQEALSSPYISFPVGRQVIESTAM